MVLVAAAELGSTLPVIRHIFAYLHVATLLTVNRVKLSLLTIKFQLISAMWNQNGTLLSAIQSHPYFTSCQGHAHTRALRDYAFPVLYEVPPLLLSVAPWSGCFGEKYGVERGRKHV